MSSNAMEVPKENMPVHGGDVLGAVELYGGDLDAYLDFSANINPLGPPDGVLQMLGERAADPASLMRYPDPRYRKLRTAITHHTGCAGPSLVLANGSAALFDAVVRTLRPTSCLLPIPAFSEYQRALQATGSRTIPFALRADNDFTLDHDAFRSALLQHRPTLCVLTNPHNPSGNIAHSQHARAIAQTARALDIHLVVDEAFIDYSPEHSLIHLATNASHLIVMRSLTKFYAMPAMRVGYAVASHAQAQAITAQLPSWPITTLAANAAIAALHDPEYERRTRSVNQRERATLTRALTHLGIRVFPSHANFLLIATNRDSATLAAALAKNHRILVRDCASYDGLPHNNYLRIAVRNAQDNERLVQAIMAETTEQTHAVTITD